MTSYPSRSIIRVRIVRTAGLSSTYRIRLRFAMSQCCGSRSAVARLWSPLWQRSSLANAARNPAPLQLYPVLRCAKRPEGGKSLPPTLGSGFRGPDSPSTADAGFLFDLGVVTGSEQHLAGQGIGCLAAIDQRHT